MDATLDDFNAAVIVFGVLAFTAGYWTCLILGSLHRLLVRTGKAIRYFRDTGLNYGWARAWRRAGQS